MNDKCPECGTQLLAISAPRRVLFLHAKDQCLLLLSVGVFSAIAFACCISFEAMQTAFYRASSDITTANNAINKKMVELDAIQKGISNASVNSLSDVSVSKWNGVSWHDWQVVITKNVSMWLLATTFVLSELLIIFLCATAFRSQNKSFLLPVYAAKLARILLVILLAVELCMLLKITPL